MMHKVIYGEPGESFAVVTPVEQGALTHFTLARTGQGLQFTAALAEQDAVYGLGETMRGVNKRGYRYVSYNTDDSHHRQDMPSLYGAHNFLIVAGAEPYGVFFDTPARTTFEVGCNGGNELRVLCETGQMAVYIIEAATPKAVAEEFLQAIGPSFLPPLWAFGFGQSRWGYKNHRDVSRVAMRYRQQGIPLDYICLDIDYMDRYIDFTINAKRFPRLRQYIRGLKKQGVRLVPIIDAGVKVEPGNPVYEQGVASGYFCTNHEGHNFQAAVWPGMTHFPDFFQPAARAWFGAQYEALTSLGFEGFWNDMNEPAIFYSEYTKPSQAGRVGQLLDFLIPARKERKAQAEPLAYTDYRNFYHNINGQKVLHHDVHNLYGAQMIRASGEGLARLLDKRYLLFSRSSYIGAHRYGGIWTGDNHSSWEMLRQNVYQMPGLNMCGFLYSGADTGGFGGNCTRELLLRWLAFSAFTPLMRNHTCMGTRSQECYAFGDTVAFANIVGLRYRLLPYIYSEFAKAALRQKMYIQPMAFAWPQDTAACDIQDQLLVGESVMIAPVLYEGAQGRSVYLPEPMTEVRYTAAGEFVCAACAQGWRFVQVPQDEAVFYIRQNTLVPVGPKLQSTAEADLANVQLLGDGQVYEQYLDDGETKDAGEHNIRLLHRPA